MESAKPSGSDEIDILEIFRSIGRSFRNFGLSVLKWMAVLRRLFVTYLILFGLLIIGYLSIAGIYYSFIRKTRFTSSMILSCDYLNSRIVGNSIEKLNLLCLEKDRAGLAEILRIDNGTALNIQEFSARAFVSEDDRIEIERLKEQLNNVVSEKKDLVSKVIGKIEIGNQKSFQIQVNVFSPDIVRELDSAIVNYFKSNQSVQNRIISTRKSLQARREKLIRESKKLDSLKSVLFANFQTMAKQSREGSNNVILSDKYLTDPIGVFKEDLALNDEIRSIDQTLAIRPDFEVIDGLTTFREPSNLRLPILLLVAVGAAIVTGYVLLGLWKFNQYLSKLA